MAEKIKVYNRCKYDYGIVTANGIHINIKPGSFAPLTEDDIAFIQSITSPGKKPFSTGRLEVAKVAGRNILDEVGIEKDEENYIEDDAQIDKRLKGSLASIKKWLNDISDKTVLYNIAMRAKALDLPTSKIKEIQAKLPDMGIFD